jgi:hypothetical protein
VAPSAVWLAFCSADESKCFILCYSCFKKIEKVMLLIGQI